jgi:DNA-binding response OmpR family regulator
MPAADTAAGNAIVEGMRVDPVITDPFMPSGSGLESLLKLKKDHPEIPVIIMSSQMDSSARREILNLGADGILIKPFRIAAVEGLISETLLKYDKAASRASHSKKKGLCAKPFVPYSAFRILHF